MPCTCCTVLAFWKCPKCGGEYERENMDGIGTYGYHITGGGISGCHNNDRMPETASGAETASVTERREDAGGGEKKEFEGITLTLLDFSAATPAGVLAKTCAAAEEKFGFKIEIETCPSDDIVRTRLAAGLGPDLLIYNTGGLLYSLNPSEFFIDLTDTEMAKSLDKEFIQAASVDGILYGVPQCDSMGAGVYYNKELYAAYGLKAPKDWGEFKNNMRVLKNAGITGMGIALDELVSTQLPFLADNYQVMYNNPDFAREFTAGKTSFAGSEEGLRSWKRYEELVPYFNEDCATVDYGEIVERFFDNRLGHMIYFSSKIPDWADIYGEEISKMGFFALPGDTKEETGLTIWPSNGIYGSKRSVNIEAVIAFLEWYASEEGLDVLTSFYTPAGVFHNGYQPKEKPIPLIEDVQRYYREGNVALALEYMTPVKGINCAVICSRLGSGRISAKEAAEAYDEECRKMALKMGVWK